MNSYDSYYSRDLYNYPPETLGNVYNSYDFKVEDQFRPLNQPEFQQQGILESPLQYVLPGPMHGGTYTPPPQGPMHGGTHTPPPQGPMHGGTHTPPPQGPMHGGTHTPPPRPPHDGMHTPSYFGGAPTAPPPLFVPQLTSVPLTAIHAPSMRRCLYRNTYVWLMNGRRFWFYPTYVGSTSVAGYRWSESRKRWAYFGIDASEIRSFQCF